MHGIAHRDHLGRGLVDPARKAQPRFNRRIQNLVSNNVRPFTWIRDEGPHVTALPVMERLDLGWYLLREFGVLGGQAFDLRVSAL